MLLTTIFDTHLSNIVSFAFLVDYYFIVKGVVVVADDAAAPVYCIVEYTTRPDRFGPLRPWLR